MSNLSAGLLTWKFLKKTFARKKVIASSTISALSVIASTLVSSLAWSCSNGSTPLSVSDVVPVPESEAGAGPLI